MTDYKYHSFISEQEKTSEEELILAQQSLEDLYEFIDDEEMATTQIGRCSSSLEEILKQDIPDVFKELGRKVKYNEPVSTNSRYYDAFLKTTGLYDDFQDTCRKVVSYIEEQTPKLDSVLADNSLIVSVLYNLTEMVVALGKRTVEARHSVDTAIASIKKENKLKALKESQNARVSKAMADHYEQRKLAEEERKEKEAYEKAAEKRREAEAERLELLALENDLRIKKELLEAKKKALQQRKLRGDS